MVKLAVAVCGQGLRDLLSQGQGIRLGGAGQRPQIQHRLLEHFNNSASAVGTAIHNPLGQLKEAPEQIKGQGRVGRGNCTSDGPVLGLQIINQGLAFSPIDVALGAGNRHQTLTHLPGRLLGTAAGRQGEAQLPLSHGITAADLHQQFR